MLRLFYYFILVTVTKEALLSTRFELTKLAIHVLEVIGAAWKLAEFGSKLQTYSPVLITIFGIYISKTKRDLA